MTFPSVSDTATSPRHRLKAIDGWRAVAALLVVLSHAINYRFVAIEGSLTHLVRRLSEPLSEVGVQLFFVISGFIITSLLMREEEERGRVSIAAFYARRIFRIIPPLVTLFLVLFALSINEIVLLPASSFVAASTFTCNIGWVDCSWHVAHTWSLAVEEQFYLIWPLLFATIAPRIRLKTLITVMIVCMIGIAVQPIVAHGNFTSFACITAGALYASVPGLSNIMQRYANLSIWLLVGSLIVLMPLLHFGRWIAPMLPVAITYLIFAGIRLPVIRALLESRPFQVIGLGSYSLYLWQQPFLAPPVQGYLPLIFLPVAVIASVILVEKPFISLGHKISVAVLNRQGLTRRA